MYKFDPKGDPPETTFRAIALDQLNEALADLDKPDGVGRSIVHEARRRCKKLRGLLRLVRPAFPGFSTENAAIRDAAALLSHLRDAQVLHQTVADLARWRPAPAVERLRDQLAAEPPSADAPGRLTEFRDRIAAVRERAEHWSLSRSGHEALIPGLRRTFRSARRRMHKACSTGHALEFHEWRKANKYHGFHVDLLKRSAPELLPAELDLSDRLSTLLGQHHDLAMLHAAIVEHRVLVADPADEQIVQSAIADRTNEIESAATGLGRQIFAERPRALARRFAAYWNSAS